MFSSHIRILIHKKQLLHNLALLKARHPMLMPVVKADAYGHGVLEVSKILAENGVEHLAVGSVEEGVALRTSGNSGFILALLGALSQNDIALAHEHGIAPLVHSYETLSAIETFFQNGADGMRMPIALKLDTGMSRLGFEPERTEELVQRLQEIQAVEPVLVLSHLAAADEQDLHSITEAQAERFMHGFRILQRSFPHLKTTLLNSPGMLTCPHFPSDLARPGFTLYGGNPLAGTAQEALGADFLPVMEVRVPVLSVHSLKSGGTVSYGCTFRAERPMNVAVIGIGYADGYPRSLSSRGFAEIRGKRAPILGRICMQMTIVDVTDIPFVQPGDPVTILGGNGPESISPAEIGDWAGTIPYELFCTLGGLNRNHRVFLDD